MKNTVCQTPSVRFGVAAVRIGIVLFVLMCSLNARASHVGDPKLTRSPAPKPQCGGDATPQTNAGTQFLLCFEKNYVDEISNDAPGADYLEIYIATLDDPATVTITSNRYPALNKVITLAARTSNVYRISTDILQYTGGLRDTLTDFWITSDETVDQRVVQVTATNNIVCYGMNNKTTTADAFLALPYSTAGTDYRILSYTNSDPLSGFQGTEAMPSQFAVAAFLDNTTVTITPSAPTAGGHPAGAPFSIKLNHGECVQVQTDPTIQGPDLTGSIVTSDLQVAVFGSHARTEIPYGWKRPVDQGQSRDMLLEQMPPTHTWGRSFVVSALERDASNFIAEGDLFRVLALNANTSITVNGVPWQTLGANQFADTMLNVAAVIQGSGPLLVGEYAHTCNASSGVGDPFLAVIPPVEQTYTDFTFFASEDVLNYTTQKVIIATDDRSKGLISYDGSLLPASFFKPLPVTAGGRNFSLTQLTVGPGVHRLNVPTYQTNDEGFSILSYGLGVVISYGYTAGTLLKPQRTVLIREPSPLSISPSKHTNRIDFYNTCCDPAYIDSATFVPDRLEDAEFGVKPFENVAYSVGRMNVGADAYLHMTCDKPLTSPVHGKLRIFSHTPNFTDMEPSEHALTLFPEAMADVSGTDGVHLTISNNPNPFSLFTNIEFSLPEAGDITLTLYDEVGRTVRTIASGQFGAGPYSIRVERKDLPNGVYMCELTSAKLNIHERLPIVAGE